jgi:four helix bundle protein
MKDPAPRTSKSAEDLIPTHGGYRNLKSFQLAQLCFDVTVRFCERYVAKRDRTYDQMVQAARSGAQNIAEGSKASGTSKKIELKLTNVARASLEELRLDYEDYLRQRRLEQWSRQDPRRAELIAKRCATAEEVADWVRELHGRNGQGGPHGPSTASTRSTRSIRSTRHTYPRTCRQRSSCAHRRGLQSFGSSDRRFGARFCRKGWLHRAIIPRPGQEKRTRRSSIARETLSPQRQIG